MNIRYRIRMWLHKPSEDLAEISYRNQRHQKVMARLHRKGKIRRVSDPKPPRKKTEEEA